jgi:hypothetical protein
VFIETSGTPSVSTVPLRANPLNTKSVSFDWILFPIIIILSLTAIIKVKFYKQISELFRGSLFFFLANKLTRDNSVLWNRIFFFLDLIFILAVPIVVIISLNYLNITNRPSDNTIQLALYVLIGIIGLKLFRLLSIKAIGFVSDRYNEIDFINYHQQIYPRVLGLLLVPIVFIMIYISQQLQPIAFVILLSTIAITMILRVVRLFQTFIAKGISLFYFILYLCALEIIPVFVIIKEFFWE